MPKNAVQTRTRLRAGSINWVSRTRRSGPSIQLVQVAKSSQGTGSWPFKMYRSMQDEDEAIAGCRHSVKLGQYSLYKSANPGALGISRLQGGLPCHQLPRD